MDCSKPDAAEWRVLGASRRNAYRVNDVCVDMRRLARPARAARLPALPQDLVIDTQKAALIVIDMVNDFCAPDGWITTMGVDVGPARALAAPIQPRDRTACARPVRR